MKNYYLKMMYDKNEDKGMVVGEVEYDKQSFKFYSMGIKDLEYFCRIVPEFKQLDPNVLLYNLKAIEFSLSHAHKDSFGKLESLIKRMIELDNEDNGLFQFMEIKH